MRAARHTARGAVVASAMVATLVVAMPAAFATSTSGNWISGQLTSVTGPPATQHYITTYDTGSGTASYDDTGLTIDGYLAFKADDPTGYASQITKTAAWVAQNKATYYSTAASPGSCTGHTASGELYAGALAKTAYEELINGTSAATELSLLACLQGTVTAGRFSDHSTYGDYSNAFGQSFAIMDFIKSPSGTVAQGGVTYLESQQCSNGAFTSSFGATCSTANYDVDSTAMAAMALKAFANHSTGTPSATAAAAASAATSWIKGQAVASGTKYYWTSTACTGTAAANVNATALAVIGIKTVNGSTSYVTGGQAWLSASPQTPPTGEMPGCTSSYPAVQASNDVRASTQGILGKDGSTYPALLGI